jgi:diaminohydroxyphosphoribosylaminopyrimidine deaminase/5-amino-6-(5-phosphoribosylamino)uracil reductase
MSRTVDIRWMDRAFALAERGRYSVSPNPMVGAVLVRGGRVVGEGFHHRAGGPHAEVVALRQAGARARGADLYVTLEPCVHHGRTPPCVDALIAAGVRRVIVAARDPNPRVAGRGLRRLSRAGISVLRSGRGWERLAERQNEKFFAWITRGRPFVLAKWASSLDGKIATSRGRSRWISGKEARRRALMLREEYDAVLVGAGTVSADNPRLTRRLGRNRITPHRRIVLDGRLKSPERARLFREPQGVLVVTALPLRHPKAQRLARRGIEVWSLPGARAGEANLRRLLRRLGSSGVTSLLVEGGGEVTWSFLRDGLVDRVLVVVAPRILGGTRAVGAVGGIGFPLSATPTLDDLEVGVSGGDLIVTGRLRGSARPALRKSAR